MDANKPHGAGAASPVPATSASAWASADGSVPRGTTTTTTPPSLRMVSATAASTLRSSAIRSFAYHTQQSIARSVAQRCAVSAVSAYGNVSSPPGDSGQLTNNGRARRVAGLVLDREIQSVPTIPVVTPFHRLTIGSGRLPLHAQERATYRDSEQPCISRRGVDGVQEMSRRGDRYAQTAEMLVDGVHVQIDVREELSDWLWKDSPFDQQRFAVRQPHPLQTPDGAANLEP